MVGRMRDAQQLSGRNRRLFQCGFNPYKKWFSRMKDAADAKKEEQKRLSLRSSMTKERVEENTTNQGRFMKRKQIIKYDLLLR